MMNGQMDTDILTLTEIRSRFPGTWILLEDPDTTKKLEIRGGRVLFHSKDRDEVYREAIARRPKHSAILYTGTIPTNVAVVL